MTPLRFRAWAKEEQGMYFDVQNGLQALGMSSMATFGEIVADTADFTVMQSTGLTDRNGVEIFEGDILRGRGIDGQVRTWKAAPLTSFHHWQETQDLIEEHGDIEAIGNIYQNPELLPQAA